MVKEVISWILSRGFRLILVLSVPVSIIIMFTWWFMNDVVKAAMGLILFAFFVIPFLGCITGLVVTIVPNLLRPFPNLIKIIWKILVGKKRDREAKN